MLSGGAGFNRLAGCHYQSSWKTVYEDVIDFVPETVRFQQQNAVGAAAAATAGAAAAAAAAAAAGTAAAAAASATPALATHVVLHTDLYVVQLNCQRMALPHQGQHGLWCNLSSTELNQTPHQPPQGNQSLASLCNLCTLHPRPLQTIHASLASLCTMPFPVISQYTHHISSVGIRLLSNKFAAETLFRKLVRHARGVLALVQDSFVSDTFMQDALARETLGAGHLWARKSCARHPVRDILCDTSCARHPVRDIIRETSCARHPVRGILCETTFARQPARDILCETSCAIHPVRDILCETLYARHPVQDIRCEASCARQPLRDNLRETSCARHLVRDILCETSCAIHPVRDILCEKSYARQPVRDILVRYILCETHELVQTLSFPKHAFLKTSLGRWYCQGDDTIGYCDFEQTIANLVDQNLTSENNCQCVTKKLSYRLFIDYIFILNIIQTFHTILTNRC